MTRPIEVNEQAVVEAYREGWSLRDLAERFGVSVQPIWRILREHEVELRKGRGPDRGARLPREGARAPAGFSPTERAAIVTRFLAGETQLALAREFRCGATTVQRILRAEGVAPGAHGQMREHHHAWKGGRTTRYGYSFIRVRPDDEIAQAMKPKYGGYVPEHRLVMAHHLGRPLLRSEQVHHVNGDKADNRIENLQLRSAPHGAGVALRCRSCGSFDVEAVDLGDADVHELV